MSLSHVSLQTLRWRCVSLTVSLMSLSCLSHVSLCLSLQTLRWRCVTAARRSPVARRAVRVAWSVACTRRRNATSTARCAPPRPTSRRPSATAPRPTRVSTAVCVRVVRVCVRRALTLVYARAKPQTMVRFAEDECGWFEGETHHMQGESGGVRACRVCVFVYASMKSALIPNVQASCDTKRHEDRKRGQSRVSQDVQVLRDRLEQELLPLFRAVCRFSRRANLPDLQLLHPTCSIGLINRNRKWHPNATSAKNLSGPQLTLHVVMLCKSNSKIYVWFDPMCSIPLSSETHIKATPSPN